MAIERYAATTQRYDVFLSHTSGDKDAVERIARRLRVEAQLEPFLDKWQLIPGNPWQEELEQALNQSRTCAVFLGPAELGPWENEEMRLALDKRTRYPAFRVIPVLLPNTQMPEKGPLPDFLRRVTWVDFRSGLDDADAFHRLVSGIKGIAPGPAVPTPDKPSSPPDGDICPYRGLETFQEKDAEFFFGRAALTQWLGERLRARRFLAVIGPSGSGKSSVVRAGLLPALRQGALPGSGDWQVVIMTPTERPLEELGARLALLTEPASRARRMRQLQDNLRADKRTLHTEARMELAEHNASARLLIVVDQFEELFTLCRDEQERRQFLDNVLYAATISQGQTAVVIAMRADFYVRSAAHTQLADCMSENQVTITPMDEHELTEAIELPARKVGLSFEAGLVDTIREDVLGQPGALPLLEHALRELWERRQGRQLTVAAYREIGGVAGAIARRAETEFGQLTPTQQAVARHILLRLVQLGEGTEDTRRRARLSELLTDNEQGEVMGAVVQQFVAARLLTTGRDSTSAEEQLDVAHEALIRGWPRLRQWVDEDRAGLRVHRRLTEATLEWERSRDNDLLYRGARLAEALELRERADLLLNPTERAFLDASQALQHRERHLAQRRIRFTVGGLLTALLLLGSVAFVALQQRSSAIEAQQRASAERDTAEQARKTALVRQLIVQAELMSSQSAALLHDSVLLAAEAMRRSPSLEADQILRRGLALLPQPLFVAYDDHILTNVVFSPDGKRIATASADKTVRLWDASDGRALARFAHASNVDALAFSPDGTHVASVSDHTAHVWDIASGHESFKVIHEGKADAVAFSPDGRYLATASSHEARVSEVASGRELGRFLHGDTVNAVVFSPDGELLATASGNPISRLNPNTPHDDNARLWRIRDGIEVARLPHEHNVWAVAFSPDQKYLVSGSADRTARIWEIESKREVARLAHQARVAALAFSPDGKRLATAESDYLPFFTSDRSARIWEVPSGREVVSVRHVNDVRAIQWSPDSTRIATLGGDRIARIWDAVSGTELVRAAGDSGGVTQVALSSDGTSFATVGSAVELRVWKIGRSDSATTLSYDGNVDTSNFSADGKLLLTGSPDRTVRAWDIMSGKETANFPHSSSVYYIAMSRDGRYVATAGSDMSATIWNARTAREITRVTHEDHVRALAFSPDGRYLATGSKDHTARLWQLPGGDETARLIHEGPVEIVVFSADSRYLATAGGESIVRIWDTATGVLIAKLVHERSVRALAFNHSGEHLATASDDRIARIWEVPAGRESARILHEDAVRTIEFSPDRRHVASVGGSIRVWNFSTGQMVARIAPGVYSAGIAFSPDGRYLVTASSDRFTRVWEVPSGREVARVLHRKAAITSGFTPDARYLVTTSGDLLSQSRELRLSLWRPEDLLAQVCERLIRNFGMREWHEYFGAEPYRPTCPTIPGHVTTMARQADSHAIAGENELASSAFSEAVEAASRQGSPEIDNILCWFGSIDGFARTVLPACERAVQAAPDNMQAYFRDSRALARARAGNRAGAIEDFRYFVQWLKSNGNYGEGGSQREAWIAALEKGQDPFDAKTLQELRGR